MIVLGIDPGSRITGFGVISIEGKRIRYLASGGIHARAGEAPVRLREIFDGIEEVAEQYRPEAVAMERVFIHINPDSALKLGQARGVALVAVARRDLPVYEYSPNQIKQAIVGRGHADKAQIQHMIRALLALPAAPPTDAADALAVALCHAHHGQYLLPAAPSCRRKNTWRNYRP